MSTIFKAKDFLICYRHQEPISDYYLKFDLILFFLLGNYYGENGEYYGDEMGDYDYDPNDDFGYDEDDEDDDDTEGYDDYDQQGDSSLLKWFTPRSHVNFSSTPKQKE